MAFAGGKKYGLHLRIPVAAQAKKAAVKPVALPAGFGADDEETAENEIARQAAKKRSLREVDELHKRALEEDPNVFDYDGVYDEIKDQQARPLREDRAKHDSKYIGKLVEKAKVRAQEQDVVRERLLVKERAKEDHLYKDKEKFVTSAYKKKLAEQAKWVEEERLRELRDQAEEVTKRSDLSDFYRNLLAKNVAFGAEKKERVLSVVGQEHRGQKPAEPGSRAGEAGSSPSPQKGQEDSTDGVAAGTTRKGDDTASISATAQPSLAEEKQASEKGEEGLASQEQVRMAPVPQRPSQDALASARERFLSRKRQREGAA